MGRCDTGLVGLMLLCCLSSYSQAIIDFTGDNLLTFCRDSVDIEGCARTHLDTSLTLFELFDIMTRDVARLERMCEDISPEFSTCLGPCRHQFLMSKYSHLKNVCSFKKWIRWEQECWTGLWALEARQCYRELYPSRVRGNTLYNLYADPSQPYDRASIARDCFPSASVGLASKCSYYQTWIFQKLLPHFFELYGYPEDFDHIPDSIGFPGV